MSRMSSGRYERVPIAIAILFLVVVGGLGLGLDLSHQPAAGTKVSQSSSGLFGAQAGSIVAGLAAPARPNFQSGGLREASPSAPEGSPHAADTLSPQPGASLQSSGLLQCLGPSASAYDSGKGEIFVLCGGNSVGSVGAISDVTNILLAMIPVGPNPQALAYDKAKGEVFVGTYPATAPYGNLSVVNDTSNLVVATVALPNTPGGVAYDSGKGEIFVSTYSGVAVVNDTNNTVVAVLPVPEFGAGIAYDPAKGEIFVANPFTNNVLVINDTTDSVVAGVATFPGLMCGYNSQIQSVVYDSGAGQIFVTCVQVFVDQCPDPVPPCPVAANVTVISDATNSVVGTVLVGTQPSGLAYDSARGEVFVTNSNSNSVSVIMGTNDSVVATINVGHVPYGNPAWDGSQGELFVPNAGSNSLSVISVATDSIVSTIALGAGPRYTVTFAETGLFTGANWSVSLEGVPESSTGNITFTGIGNATYPFIVESLPGYNENPGRGLIFVNGASVTMNVTFEKPFDVNFTENGLSGGATWYVNFTSGPSGFILRNVSAPAGAAISVTLIDGTFNCTIATNNKTYSASGPFHLTESNGAPSTVSIPFGLVTYAVSLTESGLPLGTTWSVTLDGSTQFSDINSIAFREPNGTHSFGVGTVTGYSVTPSSGSVTVVGGNQNQTLAFAQTQRSNGSPAGVLGLSEAAGYILIGGLAVVAAVSLLVATFSWRTAREVRMNQLAQNPAWQSDPESQLLGGDTTSGLRRPPP